MDYRCPHCGEIADTWPDPARGEAQVYTEACPVCARFNAISARWDPNNLEFEIAVVPERTEMTS
jgi:hypothetical protein